MSNEHGSSLANICIVYTGGTMGSKLSGGGLQPASCAEFETRVKELSRLSRDSWGATVKFTATPRLIDSASAMPRDWLEVRDVLESVWNLYDGFVVVHGTDTMPYVAAFLSFAIEHQDKPVVVTGSMTPIFQDGDARANLEASVRAASCKTADGKALDQVLICFGGRILRGNRAKKIGGEFAIDTPRVADLGYFATEGQFSGWLSWCPGLPRKVTPPGKLQFKRVNDSRVALIRLFPGVNASMVMGMLKDLDGAVVEAYGSGTGPADVRTCLEDLARAGMFIVITTEVVQGEVTASTYATDLIVATTPLISGGRMLAETALAKLYYFLGIADHRRPDWQGWVKDKIQGSVRGDNGKT